MKKQTFTFKYESTLTTVLYVYIAFAIFIFSIILGIEKEPDDWIPIIFFTLAPIFVVFLMGTGHPMKIEIYDKYIYLYYFGCPKKISWDTIEKFYPYVFIDPRSYLASKHYIFSSKQLTIFHWIHGFMKGKRYPITYISPRTEKHDDLIKIINSKVNNTDLAFEDLEKGE